MAAAKQSAFDWVKTHEAWLSKRHTEVWNFHESAWREYRSAAWYVKLLREQGFQVEEGSAGMPTAFRATFGRGGPVIASYAEYDAVPGNSQDPVPYESRAPASTNMRPATPIPIRHWGWRAGRRAGRQGRDGKA
jgi:aminobenzoyl-glutamate utilization protein B